MCTARSNRRSAGLYLNEETYRPIPLTHRLPEWKASNNGTPTSSRCTPTCSAPIRTARQANLRKVKGKPSET